MRNSSTFDSTTNYKLAGLIRDSMPSRIRAAISTGFHTHGGSGASITNVTTQIVAGTLVDQGTLPLFSAAGQLAADYVDSFGNDPPGAGTGGSR